MKDKQLNTLSILLALLATIAFILVACTISNAQTTPCPPTISPQWTLCQGYAGVGYNADDPDYTYEWKDEEGNFISNNYYIGVTYIGPTSLDTTFYYSVTNTVTGCVTSDSIILHFLPPPPELTINFENGVNTCSGQQIVLTANVSTGASVVWNKSTTTGTGWTQVGTGLTYTATQSGMYQAYATFPNNICYNQKYGIVTINEKPLQYLKDTSLCPSQIQMQVEDLVNTNCTYQWDYNNTGGNTHFIDISSGGTYTNTVIITTSTGCSTKDTIKTTVHNNPHPQINVGAMTCGQLVALGDESNNNYNHKWYQDGNLISTEDSIWTGDVDSFTVITSTQYGCAVTNKTYTLSSPHVSVDGFNFIPAFPDNGKMMVFSAINPVNENTYSWTFGDGSTSSDSNPVHEYGAGTDSALVTLTVSNNNFDDDCSFQTVSQWINTTGEDNESTGINIIDNKVGLSLYPNPASNILNINLDKGKFINAQVFTVTGRNVLSSTNKKVNVSSLTKGMYVIKLTVIYNNKQYEITKKFVKI